jgi:ADP-ribose pyrophosphatase YjhB (NUDIX family)
MSTLIVIGLSAVVVAIRDGEAVVLTVRPHDPLTGAASTLAGLPFGPFDPDGHRTFELALRAFVTEQTRFDLGYVEQLYTFGDKGRDAPLADVGAGAARVISVGYLALTPVPVETSAPDTAWSSWSRFFPWEDWRQGRPLLIDEAIAPALRNWAVAGRGDEGESLRGAAVEQQNVEERRRCRRPLGAEYAHQAKLQRANTPQAQAVVGILDIILRDEVGHVAIGNHWYRWLCAQRGLDPEAHYPSLVAQYDAPHLKPPFNDAARLQAGFSAQELAALHKTATAPPPT